MLELSVRRAGLKLQEVDLALQAGTAIGWDGQRNLGMAMTVVTGHQTVRIDGEKGLTVLIDAVCIGVHKGNQPVGAGTGAKHPAPRRIKHKVVDQAPIPAVI